MCTTRDVGTPTCFEESAKLGGYICNLMVDSAPVQQVGIFGKEIGGIEIIPAILCKR